MAITFRVEREIKSDYPHEYQFIDRLCVGDELVVNSIDRTVNGVPANSLSVEVCNVLPDGSCHWIIFVNNPWSCLPAHFSADKKWLEGMEEWSMDRHPYSADPYYGSCA
jgi:hypothetical protein